MGPGGPRLAPMLGYIARIADARYPCNWLCRSHSIFTLGKKIVHDEVTNTGFPAANFLALIFFFFALVLPLGVSALLSLVGGLLLRPSMRSVRFTQGASVVNPRCDEECNQQL